MDLYAINLPEAPLPDSVGNSEQWMLKNFVTFYEASQRAVETSSDMTYAKIRDGASDVIYKLSQMKFESPNTQSEEEITGKFDALYNEIGETFRRLQE